MLKRVSSLCSARLIVAEFFFNINNSPEKKRKNRTNNFITSNVYIIPMIIQILYKYTLTGGLECYFIGNVKSD